jgi:cellulose synthase/poly-beta-1,6-N-acetylglucosamine synthase-like glycosyltransferase
VSVVIPNYNYEKTLPACLASVYAQTLTPYEVIVVDDASTDRSTDVVRRFPCRLVESPVNRGVSAARNVGAAISGGDVLFFLDSDVALAPDALHNAVRALGEDPGCGCVYGVYGKVPLVDDGPIERYRILHLHHALTRAAGVTGTAVFALAAVPRAVFDEVGGFDENLRCAEDDEYSDRLLARYRIRLSDTVIGYHDDVDRLLPLLAEQYRRAQLVPFSARNRLRPGGLRLNSTIGVLAAGLAVVTLPPALVWPPLLLAPALFVAVFAAADPGLSRFVRQERGARFLAFFTTVHLLVNMALIAGTARGWLRVAMDPEFGPTRRRKLQPTAGATSMEV